jgi:two-component system CheB/CheR fusion protein
VWSAGCATGEEAYTLALLLADQLGPEFSEWNIKIFATDLNEDAISFARRGLYPANVLKDLPDDFRERYFEPIDHGYRISKHLRQTVIFGNQDLSRGVPFPRINLVLCRNLLIYLKPELQQTVLDLFAYSLHESHGYLFLGKAETARPTNATFDLMNKKWKIYRCISGPIALPPQHEAGTLRLGLAYRAGVRRTSESDNISAIKDLTAAEIEVAQLRRINEGLLRCVTGGVVIIDRSYRILTINAAARRLLSVRDLAYDQDFLHTVRGLPYQEVRNLIDNAFREHITSSINELELDQVVAGMSKHVSITVMLMPVESGAPELAVINISEITDQVQTKLRLEAVQLEQVQLVAELSGTNKRFGHMNKELQDANEELQAANEELMLTQEELQATNEEFEATNEELQATNEELETNNEELQATNEELQTTNDELTARTNELQEITKRVEDDQAQLAALVESFPYYIVLVSSAELQIETINPAYRLSLQGRDVIGMQLGEAFTGSDLEQFLHIVKGSVSNDSLQVTPPIRAALVATDDERDSDFTHTIVPVHDGNGHVSAVLIYSELA